MLRCPKCKSLGECDCVPVQATLAWERLLTHVGLTRRQDSHPRDCVCESCGPLHLVGLSDYEAKRLLDALERRDGSDTGDWHAQVRCKLRHCLGRTGDSQ